MNTEVVAVKDGSVLVAGSDDEIVGDCVILAVDQPALKNWVSDLPEAESQSTSCFYFSIPRGLVEPSSFLYLSSGPVANLCFPNHIQSTYAPEKFDLISATVVDPEFQGREDIVELVEKHICNTFSISKKQLFFLKKYFIRHSLPSQKQAPLMNEQYQLKGYKKVFLAGEIVDTPSINGALSSGKKAVNTI